MPRRYLGSPDNSTQLQDLRQYLAGLLATQDSKYGWLPALCSRQAAFICEISPSTFPCFPPPLPPPPPPQPPSPPSPPAAPSCAPPSSPTFFCDAGSGSCYNMSTVKRNFTAARAVCSAGGGELVMLDSPTKQLMVERYFQSRATLPADLYWHGISRRVAGRESRIGWCAIRCLLHRALPPQPATLQVACEHAWCL